MTDPTGQRTDDPRATYVKVATQVFAAEGYHGASLARLAQASGVTKQALLHFFGTKARLYGDVLTDLARRLCADIEAASQPDPSDHLRIYFLDFRAAALASPDDVRLVVRALLDSDDRSRHWPMKPYLDRLISLARRTPGGQGRSDTEILAWLSQMIGAIQYMAISSPAISGMYGQDASKAVARQFDTMIYDSVHAFVAPRR